MSKSPRRPGVPRLFGFKSSLFRAASGLVACRSCRAFVSSLRRNAHPLRTVDPESWNTFVEMSTLVTSLSVFWLVVHES